MSRMYGIYIGIQKNTSVDNFYYSYSRLICIQRLTMANTTIANHGRRRQKWPPSAPHEALHPVPMQQMDGRQPPEQVDIIFVVLRVCMALKILQYCGDVHRWNKGVLQGPYSPSTTPKNIRLLGGLSPIHSTSWHRAQGLMWGARGKFLPEVAMEPHHSQLKGLQRVSMFACQSLPLPFEFKTVLTVPRGVIEKDQGT
jgi:hypothetical protein